MQAVMRFILVLVALSAFAPTSYALDQTETGFHYPIGKAQFESDGGTWLGRDAAHESASEAPHYFAGYYHIGVDMMHDLGKDAYAIADGRIVFISYDKPGDGDGKKWGVGNCALVVEHKTTDAEVFTAVYGHLQCSSLPAKYAEVEGGVSIGKIGHWDHGDHLHFAIHDGPFRTMAKSGWGMMANSEWRTPCEGNSTCTNTFTNPVAFIQTHFAFNPSTEKQVACQGHVCWSPKTVACETATMWYKGLSDPVVQAGIPWMFEVGREICDDLHPMFNAVAAAEDPSEVLPEGSLWWNFMRFIHKMLGETASAQEIAQAMSTNWTINTINVYTGNVVAGNASKAVYGTGQGYPVQAATPPTLVPPDFITKRTWLTTPWGTETYKYGLNESFNTKAQFENIGEGTCPIKDREPTTIISHFYLSRGYKEDPHSGDGAWRRLDSTTTQCDNLKPGDTHTETKNTVIREWITEPGIYNIVACIDHPQDDHNNGGEHDEKHESNNCSTEAVIEVVEGTVNVPDVDLTPSGFTLLQAPTYAGDFVRLGATITNQGTVNATADIRSAYTVSCNGGSNILLTDDGTMASSLTAGASAWEETLTPVQLPNVVGTCTLSFFTDYQGTQPETDETNNSASLTVTLAPKPPPQPDFIVRAVGPAGGSASIKAGSKFYPAMYVKNVGTAPSPAAVRSSYWFMGPGTGGTWTYITDDGTEASKLCVGCEEREQYDGGMKISARGTYYFKGCADYQGAVTESNEANNCTVSSPITVY